MKKLKQGEIDALLEKIRFKYDDFIGRYNKSVILRNSFEQRYLEALHYRMDLTRFLTAEMEAIQELEAREIQEMKKLLDKKKASLAEEKEKKNIAQKVWEENLRRIQHYPEFPLAFEASHEIAKLIGAMKWYEQEYWTSLDTLAISSGNSRQADFRISLETGWRSFTVDGRDGVPSRLAKYKSLSSRFPKDVSSTEWEERQILFDAAGFLGRVRDYIEELSHDDRFTQPQKDKMITAREELENLLADFRLMDLIRLSQKR